MEKKKRKKWPIITLIAVLVIMLLESLFIGYRFSWGPFKKLGDIRMSKLPGNDPKYDITKSADWKTAFLQEKTSCSWVLP